MSYDQEAKFYGEILDRLLNEKQKEKLDEINKTTGTETCVIRSDPSRATMARKRQRTKQDVQRSIALQAERATA